MKLTSLLQLSMVWIPMLNNLCICAEQDTEENVLTSVFKNEIMNFRDTIWTEARIGLIGLIFVVSGTLTGIFTMHSFLPWIIVIFAWPSGLQLVVLWHYLCLQWYMLVVMITYF